LIQDDILKRCQDVLRLNRIPIAGLTVDGRDVLVTGPPNSPIVSSRALLALEKVTGVRIVRAQITYGTDGTSGNPGAPSGASEAAPARPADLALEKEIQARIDAELTASGIQFRSDTATLTAESELLLDKIATHLTENPRLACEIRGLDSQPREIRQNWVLALQRALATEDYLETKGISDARLSTRVLEAGQASDGRPTDRLVDLVVKTQ
jgi:outer membrane protein OmpA-like peptidoglycan-associated protein